MLLAGAPAVDAVESDVVARINAERAARALPRAVQNTRLSMAADMQATWLTISAVGLGFPVLSHLGPFGSTLPFRLGEVSFPVPEGGAEIAATGLTAADAFSYWMASAPHVDQMLAPGAMLIGVAKVGSVIVVTMHPPCPGCHRSRPPAAARVRSGPVDQAAPSTPRARRVGPVSSVSGSGDRAGSSARASGYGSSGCALAAGVCASA